MHKALDDNADGEVCYRTKNLHAPNRHIDFFLNAPHLIRSTRNSLYSSGYGKFTRQDFLKIILYSVIVVNFCHDEKLVIESVFHGPFVPLGLLKKK